MLGVCPQHDVLWNDLTALEHMKLFAHLKDIPPEVMGEEIATLLEEVKLTKVWTISQASLVYCAWEFPLRGVCVRVGISSVSSEVHYQILDSCTRYSFLAPYHKLVYSCWP